MGLTPEGTGGRHAAAPVPNRIITSPEVRKWLYIALAVGLIVAQGVGWITREQSDGILEQLVQLLGAGGLLLGAVNTPRGT